MTLSGELDMAADEELTGLLAMAAGRDGVATVLVDLAYVTFLDCSTVTVLIAAHQAARAAGRRLVVRGATRSVRRVLEVTGALEILT